MSLACHEELKGPVMSSLSLVNSQVRERERERESTYIEHILYNMYILLTCLITYFGLNRLCFRPGLAGRPQPSPRPLMSLQVIRPAAAMPPQAARGRGGIKARLGQRPAGGHNSVHSRRGR